MEVVAHGPYLLGFVAVLNRVAVVLNKACVLSASLDPMLRSGENAVHVVYGGRDPIYPDHPRSQDRRIGLGEKGGDGAVKDNGDWPRLSIKDVTLAAGLILALVSIAAFVSPRYLEAITDLLTSCTCLTMIVRGLRS